MSKALERPVVAPMQLSLLCHDDIEEVSDYLPMTSSNVLFSSATDLWYTPIHFFEELDNEFSFTLDPCATDENHKCAKYFTKGDNGLVQDWSGERVFMNPPYGRDIGRWMEKARTSGTLVVCLVPARTDTAWWHENVMQPGVEIRFIRGRLKFGGSKNSAPFPSAVVVFRPN